METLLEKLRVHFRSGVALKEVSSTKFTDNLEVKHIVPPTQPELLKEIEEFAIPLDKTPKSEQLHGTIKNALGRIVEVTTAKILRDLQHQGRVKREDVKGWNSIRNHVMHGNLVLPWSDKDEDGKIIALASLFHALTRETAIAEVCS